MEHKIGEIFEYNGEWYQCLKGLGCNECDLSKLTCYHRFESGSCSPNMRKDGIQVIFKKLEKLGSILGINGKTYQCIKPMHHNDCIGCVFAESCKYICSGQGIYVETKQNKEIKVSL